MDSLQKQLKPERSFWDWLLVILAMILLGVGIFQTYLYFQKQKANSLAVSSNNQNNQNNNENAQKEELSPIQSIAKESAGDPSKFLSLIEEKAQESKKEYDKGLSFISQKKWESLFAERNKLGSDYVENNIKILNSSLEDYPDGSVFFKINYEVNASWAKASGEDGFFLILSKEKLSSLGLPSEKANVFLTEKEVGEYLGEEGFGKIGKVIAGKDPVYSSLEEAEKALSELLKSSPRETKIILGDKKTTGGQGESEGHFFLRGETESNGKCQVGFLDLFDKNIKLVSECQN